MPTVPCVTLICVREACFLQKTTSEDSTDTQVQSLHFQQHSQLSLQLLLPQSENPRASLCHLLALPPPCLNPATATGHGVVVCCSPSPPASVILQKLISASFTPRSSHPESQRFLKGKGDRFLFLHYLARLVSMVFSSLNYQWFSVEDIILLPKKVFLLS